MQNSIILIPNGSGIFTCYNASGNTATINNSSLIIADLFSSLLGFDSNIWDFSNMNISQQIYPVLR